MKMGSLTTGVGWSAVTPGPMATSASLLEISTACSSEAATLVWTSTAPANRLVNASIRGPATNSANADDATTRNCSAAPWAARWLAYQCPVSIARPAMPRTTVLMKAT